MLKFYTIYLKALYKMKNDDIQNEILRVLKEGIEKMKTIHEDIAPEINNTKVIFDKSTQPFEVEYSERGFEINGVRFSFEFLETALSKKVFIVLDKGQGITLDSVKIEKILKYKYLYQQYHASNDSLSYK